MDRKGANACTQRLGLKVFVADSTVLPAVQDSRLSAAKLLAHLCCYDELNRPCVQSAGVLHPRKPAHAGAPRHTVACPD